MDILQMGGLLLFIMLLLLTGGVWIAMTLAICGWVGQALFPGEVVVKKAWPTQPQIASVMAIHTPPVSSSNMMNSSKPPICRISIVGFCC